MWYDFCAYIQLLIVVVQEDELRVCTRDVLHHQVMTENNSISRIIHPEHCRQEVNSGEEKCVKVVDQNKKLTGCPKSQGLMKVKLDM